MNKKVSAIIAAGVLALGMGFGGCNPGKKPDDGGSDG